MVAKVCRAKGGPLTCPYHRPDNLLTLSAVKADSWLLSEIQTYQSIAAGRVSRDWEDGYQQLLERGVRYGIIGSEDGQSDLTDRLASMGITDSKIINQVKIATTQSAQKAVLTKILGNVGERLELATALQLLKTGKLGDGTKISNLTIGEKVFTPQEISDLISDKEVSSMVEEIRRGEYPPFTALLLIGKLGLVGKVKAKSESKRDLSITVEGQEIGISIKSDVGNKPTWVNYSKLTAGYSSLVAPSGVDAYARLTELQKQSTHPDEQWQILQSEGWTKSVPQLHPKFNTTLSKISPSAPKIWLKLLETKSLDSLSTSERDILQTKILPAFATKYNPAGLLPEEVQAQLLVKIDKSANLDFVDLTEDSPSRRQTFLNLRLEHVAGSKGMTGLSEFANGTFGFLSNFSIREA